MKVNAIICSKCDTIIYSRAIHDFRTCKCESISIDGGFDYIRVLWDDKKVSIPKQIQLDVLATKEELYNDWNSRKDIYGMVNFNNSGSKK